MGFNNEGASHMAQRLRATRKVELACGCGVKPPENQKVTPLDKAVEDYVSTRQLVEFADYLVINVSSPNTPGLRELPGMKVLYVRLFKVYPKWRLVCRYS